MPPARRPSARTAPRDSGGFDVWLPALVAIAAAIFMLTSAAAQTAAPRPIYDAARFDVPTVTPVSPPAPVVAIALPAPPVTHPAPAAPLRPSILAPYGSRDPFSPARLAAALGISALLIGALLALGRTWRRLELRDAI